MIYFTTNLDQPCAHCTTCWNSLYISVNNKAINTIMGIAVVLYIDWILFFDLIFN